MHSTRFNRPVIFTRHALQRMALRSITALELLDVVDTGDTRFKDETHLWAYKQLAGRTDNLICAYHFDYNPTPLIPVAGSAANVEAVIGGGTNQVRRGFGFRGNDVVDTTIVPPRPRLYGLVGAEMIEEAWKERQGAGYNLKAFHEAFLAQGTAPVKYIRQALLPQGKNDER